MSSLFGRFASVVAVTLAIALAAAPAFPALTDDGSQALAEICAAPADDFGGEAPFLAENDAAALLERALRARLVDEQTGRRALEAAEGNPLFLEQLLAIHAEHGEQLHVPPTVHAVLAETFGGAVGAAAGAGSARPGAQDGASGGERR